MLTLSLMSTADMNYFTGFESVRIQNLLLFLSLLSISIWALVVISILIRWGAKVVISRRVRSRDDR
jgi:hypothetical protein